MASRLQDVILRGTAVLKPLATAVAPGTLYYSTDTQVTERSNGTIWESYADAGGGGGSGINQLTGDVTAGPGTGSQVATLANTAVVPGSYTSTNLTVDAKGRITAAASSTGTLPSLHASTHGVAGSDPVTVAESQVTNLTTDLAAKASTTHATTHSSGGSDPVTVTNLAGYPGGTTTFLRADHTFAAPSSVLPTDVTGKVLISQGAGVTPIFDNQVILIGPTSSLILKPVVSPGYEFAFNDAAGAFTFGRIGDTTKATLTTNETINVVKWGNTIGSGILDFELIGGTIIFCPSAGGNAGLVQFGRRATDSSPGVGVRAEFWPYTGQTDPVLATMNPGGTVKTFWIDPDGTLHALLGFANDTPLNASQLLSGTVPNARLSIDVLRFTGGYPGGTTTFLRADGTFATPSGSGGGAPIDAQYWVSTADATLSAEKNIGALASGYVKSTVSAGVSTPSTVASIPAADGGTGVTTGLTVLDATNLTTGTVPAAALTAANLPAHASRHNAGGADAMAIDSAAGTGSLRTLGTSSTSAAAGNDSRLSDSRTPTAHATSHKSGGSDVIALDTLGATTDITTLNSSTSAHGLLPKLSGTTGTFLRGDGTFSPIPTRFGVITFVIDNGASVITTGLKGFLEIPFPCSIMTATLLADVSGSIVIDIWKDTYANYPPTVADTITASAKPTISSALKSQDATLTGWTITITTGDILGFNVDSVTSIKRVTLSLKIQAT